MTGLLNLLVKSSGVSLLLVLHDFRRVPRQATWDFVIRSINRNVVFFPNQLLERSIKLPI